MYGEGVLHEQFSGIGSRETKNRSVESCEAGRCIIRDNKGPELVMLPNSRLVNLELHKDWSLKLERLRTFFNRKVVQMWQAGATLRG